MLNSKMAGFRVHMNEWDFVVTEEKQEQAFPESRLRAVLVIKEGVWMQSSGFGATSVTVEAYLSECKNSCANKSTQHKRLAT